MYFICHSLFNKSDLFIIVIYKYWVKINVFRIYVEDFIPVIQGKQHFV